MAMTPEGIGAWMDLFNRSRVQGAERPHLKDLAQANRDKNVGQAGITGARAQFAPQLFGSQAQQAENQAGISGINLQYAPQLKEQSLQGGGMTNMINQLKLQQMQAQMNAPPGFKGTGSIGQLIQGREETKSFYGEDSEELGMYDQMMQQKLKGSQGITMYGPEGQPMVQIGGSGGSGAATGSGGQVVDPETGEFFSPLTRTSQTKAQKSLAGIANVKDFLGDVKEYLPQFQSPYTSALEQTQGVYNRFLSPLTGKELPLPTQRALGEAGLKKAVEGYMAAFELPQAEISIHLVDEIFKPRKGETESQYDARIGSEIHHIEKVADARRGAIARGQKLGSIKSMKQLNKWSEENKDLVESEKSEPTFDPTTMEWR